MTERSFWAVLSCGLCVVIVSLGGKYVESVEENHRMAALQYETMLNAKTVFDVCEDNMRLAVDSLKRGTAPAVKRGTIKKIKRTWRPTK